jgi:NAD(P)-dependent dehydrogenase (short-subunit alcohol dehydrogenase family)
MSFIEEMFDVRNKIAVITGGGGAIAGGFSEALLKAGARVALWDIAPDALDAARKRLSELTGKGAGIQCVKVDAMDEASVAAAVAETEKGLGVPNVLINAAGGNRGKNPFVETDMKLFDFVMKLNIVAGLMVPTKVVAKYWIDRKVKGTIVNMASMNSYLPLSGIWAYSAAKAGVLNLTQACAKEFAPYGIRVNAIAPGFFVGKQNKDLLIKNEATGELTERGKSIVARTPFGRFGQAEELAGTLLFLLSDKAASFVTGVSVPVDGGYLIDNI